MAENTNYEGFEILLYFAKNRGASLDEPGILKMFKNSPEKEKKVKSALEDLAFHGFLKAAYKSGDPVKYKITEDGISFTKRIVEQLQKQ